MNRLEFVRGPGIVPPCKSAKGMWSGEGEYVPFHSIFTCVGAVENYLCDLEKMMVEFKKFKKL
jgi:hypothetical protein